MDEILKELARAARASVDNDMEIINVIKSLTERHLALEKRVDELEGQVTALVNIIHSRNFDTDKLIIN